MSHVSESSPIPEGLGESLGLFNLIAENISDIVWVFGLDLRMTYISPSVYRVRGYRPDELVGKPIEELHPPEVSIKARALLADELRRDREGTSGMSGAPGGHAEEAGAFEFETLKKDGSVVRLEAMMSFLRDSAGKPTGIFGVSRDVTARKRAEDELRRMNDALASMVAERTRRLGESEELFRRIGSSALDAIILADGAGRVVYWNGSAERMFGFKQEEVLGREMDGLVIPERYRAAYRRGIGSFAEHGGQGRYVGRTAEVSALKIDGTEFAVEISLSALTYNGTPHALGIVRDISERREVQCAVEESERLYREIVEEQTEFIVRFRPDGTITFVNEAGCRNLKMHCGEIVGMDFLSFVAEEDRDRIVAQLYALTPDSPIGTIEDRISLPGRGEARWHQWTNRAIFDRETGKPLEYLAVGRDITNRKLMEEALRESLIAKDMLIKEVHHRVKNNLAVVQSLLSLQSRQVSDEHARELFVESEYRVKAMGMIHERLYRSSDLTNVDFSEYLISLTRQIFKNYRVSSSHVSLEVDVPPVYLDVDTLIPCGLIVNELVTNACKYAFPALRRGEILVGLKQRGDHDYTLTVRDDGIGLPPDLDLETVGSLGLQIVGLLAAQIGGTLELDRSGGTSFSISFRDRKIH